MKYEWIYCPICKKKTHNKFREDTVLKNYPLYCPKCKRESEEASSNIGGIRKAEGKNIKMLKNDISSYFLIKEAAINIWE